MQRLQILLLFCLSSISSLNAQNLIERSYDINVFQNGLPLANPWLGGLYNPQFYPLDIDADGDEDLFILDSQGNSNLCFENTMVFNGQNQYVYKESWAQQFPIMENWMQVQDYNCDGIKDILTYESSTGSIRQFRGKMGTDGLLDFDLEDNFLNVTINGVTEMIQLNQLDRPYFKDIDFDGDTDMLVFNAYDQINFYQNQSATCENLELALVSDCWGQFEEDLANNQVLLNADCSINFNLFAPKNPLHIGLTRILLYDYEGDDDWDLLYAYGGRFDLNFLTNGGTAEDALMTNVDSLFPMNTMEINLPDYPAPYLIDMDSDGIEELVISPSSEGVGIENCWLYENNGTADFPVWERTTTDFLQGEMLNVGAYSHPTLVDVDLDGLTDLVVSNRGRVTGLGTFATSLSMYKNIGTLTEPAFELIDADWMGFSNLTNRNLKTTFGDLDADGDQDLLFGDSKGKLFFVENIAATGETIQLDTANIQFLDIDLGDFATPQLVDVDQDGLLDILTGEVLGRIFYYKNIGTPTAFEFVLENDFWGSVNVRPENSLFGYSTPYMVRLKEGSERILLVGNLAGEISAYRGADAAMTALEVIAPELDIVQTGAHASPTVLLGEEGEHRLFSGTIRGGLYAYAFDNNLLLPTSVQNAPTEKDKLLVYPNPTNNILHFKLENENIQQVTIYTTIGQAVQQYPLNKNEATINVENLTQGIYLFEVETQSGQRIWRKILIQ